MKAQDKSALYWTAGIVIALVIVVGAYFGMI